jgi:predicted dehydrogenase
LYQATASGQIGTLTAVNCDFYIGAHFGGFRDAMPSPLILDMAIHHFDLIRYYTKADPVSVYAREFNPQGSWYKGDAAASCIFEMSNGIIFTYRGSWCAEGCHTSWHGDWRIIGEKGTLLFAGDALPTGQKVVETGGFHSKLAPVEVMPAVVPKVGMHGGLCEMLDFLRDGKIPQTVCTDNIKSLAMVFAAMESSRKGRKVAVTW